MVVQGCPIESNKLFFKAIYWITLHNPELGKSQHCIFLMKDFYDE